MRHDTVRITIVLLRYAGTIRLEDLINAVQLRNNMCIPLWRDTFIPLWHDPFIPLRDDSGIPFYPRSTNNGCSYPDGRVDMRLHTLDVWRDGRVCESTVEDREEVGL